MTPPTLKLTLWVLLSPIPTARRRISSAVRKNSSFSLSVRARASAPATTSGAIAATAQAPNATAHLAILLVCIRACRAAIIRLAPGRQPPRSGRNGVCKTAVSGVGSDVGTPTGISYRIVARVLPAAMGQARPRPSAAPLVVVRLPRPEPGCGARRSFSCGRLRQAGVGCTIVGDDSVCNSPAIPVSCCMQVNPYEGPTT